MALWNLKIPVKDEMCLRGNFFLFKVEKTVSILGHISKVVANLSQFIKGLKCVQCCLSSPNRQHINKMKIYLVFGQITWKLV